MKATSCCFVIITIFSATLSSIPRKASFDLCGDQSNIEGQRVAIAFDKNGLSLRDCSQNRVLETVPFPCSYNFEQESRCDWKDHLLDEKHGKLWTIREDDVCLFNVSTSNVTLCSCQKIKYANPNKLVHCESDRQIFVLSEGENDLIHPIHAGGASYINISNSTSFSVEKIKKSTFHPSSFLSLSRLECTKTFALMVNDQGRSLHLIDLQTKTHIREQDLASIGCKGYVFSSAGSKKRDSVFLSCKEQWNCVVIEVTQQHNRLVQVQQLPKYCGDLSIEEIHGKEYLSILKTSGIIPLILTVWKLDTHEFKKENEYFIWSFVRNPVYMISIKTETIIVIEGLDPGQIVTGNLGQASHNLTTVRGLLDGEITGVFSTHGDTFGVTSSLGVSIVSIKYLKVVKNISDSSIQRLQVISTVQESVGSKYVQAQPTSPVIIDLPDIMTSTPDMSRAIHLPSSVVDDSDFPPGSMTVLMRIRRKIKKCDIHEPSSPLKFLDLQQELHCCENQKKIYDSKYYGKASTKAVVDLLHSDYYKYEQVGSTVMITAGTDNLTNFLTCIHFQLPPLIHHHPPTLEVETSKGSDVQVHFFILCSAILLGEFWQCLWRGS